MNQNQKVIDHRHRLHQLAEISGQEHRTAAYVKSVLEHTNPTRLVDQIGGTGIIAQYVGPHPGKSIMLRAELDALPIDADPSLDYRSENPTVSHRCGHDGHMAMLLGVALGLIENPITHGELILLFQPAEETGTGAKQILSDPKFSAFHPDFAFAIHNLPGYPMHQFVTRSGAITAAVRSLIIRLDGITAHAAEPENGTNPAFAIRDLISFTEKITNPNTKAPEFFLATIVHMNLGELAYGVSAGYGELHLTIRAWTESVMESNIDKLLAYIKEVENQYGLTIAWSWTDVFEGNFNDEQAVGQVINVAQAASFDMIEKETPIKWGEDFGAFTNRIPGALIGLGAGIDTPALHHPNYNFPDDLLATGIKFWETLIDHILGRA